MKNLKNKLTASMISFLVMGSSCLSTVFAGPLNDGQNSPGVIQLSYGNATPLGLTCDMPSYGNVMPLGLTCDMSPYGNAMPLGLTCDMSPDEYLRAAPNYGVISQPGEYKKNPRPPRSEREEKVRRSLKSTISVSRPSECINVSDGQPDGTSPFELSAKLPDSPTQEINVSNTGRPEISVPLSENPSTFTPSKDSFIVETVPSIEELWKEYPEIARALDNFRYKGGSESFSSKVYFEGINKNFRNVLVSWYPENKDCLRGKRRYERRRDIEFLLGKTGYVNYKLPYDNINSRICGIVKKAVEVKQREEFHKKEFTDNIKKFVCKLKNEKYAVDSKILRYVNEKYIYNDTFLRYSRELCPSVTSYSIVFCMGTPWFVKYIVDDVKQKFPDASGKDLLNLAISLQRMFFGTLVYRLHQTDSPTVIRDGQEVRYVGEVELDSPIADEILGKKRVDYLI